MASMTSRPQSTDDRSTDRGTPGPGDAGRRRDRGLRLSRRLTRSLVGASAALVLGFSVLAATTTGATGGTANPVTTTDTGPTRTTSTTGGSASDATTDATGSSGSDAQATGSDSASAPSSSSAAPSVTSGAS